MKNLEGDQKRIYDYKDAIPKRNDEKEYGLSYGDAYPINKWWDWIKSRGRKAAWMLIMMHCNIRRID